MSKGNPGTDQEALRARHGARSEVNWEGGSGRHPYSNRGTEESESPADTTDFAEGDRGELSGRNLQQLEKAKRKP
jgi:hypothetical protein